MKAPLNKIDYAVTLLLVPVALLRNQTIAALLRRGTEVPTEPSRSRAADRDNRHSDESQNLLAEKQSEQE